MTEILRRHSLSLTALFLIGLSFQLMGSSVRHPELPRAGGRIILSLLAPVDNVFHEISESSSYLWRRYLWLIDVQDQNADLRGRVDALESLNSRLLEFESENERLRQLLEFKTTTALEGSVATVVGRDPSNWTFTVNVDRGLRDGVVEGSAVVVGDAVVGQTTAVTQTNSRVQLLTDGLSAISTIVQRNRAPGIAEGMQGKLLRLRYVESQYKVLPGDRIITSGLDGVYPKGLLVGVVTEVRQAERGLFHTITVQPSADLTRLEQVMILKRSE